MKNLSGFYKLTPAERMLCLQEICGLTAEEADIFSGQTRIDPSLAGAFIENSVGFFPLPLGIATNFVIDNEAYCIPMAIEETSVIAAASSAAKWIKQNGKISTYVNGHYGIGQIHIPAVQDLEKFQHIFETYKKDWIQYVNLRFPQMVARGGGLADIVLRAIHKDHAQGWMVILHLLYDTKDSMGANIITQAAEVLKPVIQDMTGQAVGICILSNLVDTKCVGVNIKLFNVPSSIQEGIVEAMRFAKLDPYRAATHNKGVLNGIDAVVIATGNDWRAVEAGIHSYACRSGAIQPITKWWVEEECLMGHMEIPLSLGICGGMTHIHPLSRIALKILRVSSAQRLAQIVAAVGLVQNLAALKALVSSGVMKGHMRLHASNLALQAGAQNYEVSAVVQHLILLLESGKKITLSDAQSKLQSIRQDSANVYEL